MSIRPVDLSGMIQRTQDIGNIKHAEDSRPVADQYNIEVRQEKQESDLSHKVQDPEQNSAVIAETETTEPEETEQKNEQQIAAEKLQQETETQMEVPKEPETETPQESVVSDTENAENAEQTQQEPFTLVVNRGDVCRTMCENLAANGVIDDSEGLRKYLSEVGYASFISAGTYQIPYHASYEEITNILKAGPMEQQQQ